MHSLSRLPSLDGLRGICVLMVIAAHLPAIGDSEVARQFRDVARILKFGQVGVDIFFILSGFLITRILVEGKQEQASLQEFFIRRSLRILPIYLLLIVVVGLARPGPDVAWSALYLGNFYFSFDGAASPLRHTWSLAVEEHFYLIWPFIVYGLSERWFRLVTLWVVPALAVTCACAVCWTLPPVDARSYIYCGTPFRMLSLSLGAALVYLRPSPRPRWRVLLVALLGACLLSLKILLPKAHVAIFWPVYLLVGCAFMSQAVVRAGILFNGNAWTAVVLESPALRYLGKISYGLYLYHFPIFFAFGIATSKTAPAQTVFLALATTIAITLVSWRLFESPLLALRDKLAPSPAGGAARKPAKNRQLINAPAGGVAVRL